MITTEETKMDNIVTNDLSEFGFRELKQAGELLSALKTDKDRTKFLGDGVQVFFNRSSGYVFLSDEDYNTAIINSEGILEDFINCPECGAEDLASDFKQLTSECCQEHAKAIDL
jgi:hypothetical protein